MTPIVLRTDQVWGVFASVDEADADSLCATLTEAHVRFATDLEEAARVAESGSRTFFFAESLPQRLRGVLANYDIPATVAENRPPHENKYRPPVEQLLRRGQTSLRATGTDYAALGLGREHVAELIRMATDEELHGGPPGSPVVWAPVHAWWALAQLRAEEAIVPLLALLRRVDDENDDYVSEDLPRVLGEIGPAAVAPAAEYLANPEHGEWARVAAAKTLRFIGEKHPAAQAECVARLTAQLEKFAEQSETLNAFLISPLLDLRAIEAAPLMERAFAAERVDEMVAGDWEDIQIELGLKTKRGHPRKPNEFTKLGEEMRTALGYKLNEDNELVPLEPQRRESKVGRNDPCPCGSGKKFKKCCGS
jgi:hypothetical protein